MERLGRLLIALLKGHYIPSPRTLYLVIHLRPEGKRTPRALFFVLAGVVDYQNVRPCHLADQIAVSHKLRRIPR